MSSSRSKYFWFWLKLTITALLILFLICMFDWNRIFDIIQHLSIFDLFIAAFVWIISLLVTTSRWYILSIPLQCNTRFWQLFRFYYIGFFFNTFLPSSIGGDLYRIYRVNKELSSKSQAAALVFVERLIGFFAIAFMASFSLFFIQINKFSNEFRYLAFGSFLILLAVLLLSFNERVILHMSRLLKKISYFHLGERLNQFYEKIYHFRNYKLYLYMGFIISIIYQLIVIYLFYFVARAMDYTIGYMYMVLFVSLSSIVSLIPFSLGGFGYREISYALLFQAIGLAREDGIALSIIVVVITSIINAGGGIFYILDKNLKS